MKKRALVYQVLIVTLFIIITSNCKKDDESPINQTNGKTTAVFNSDLTYGKMTDQDGNIYKTITIGNQTWMAENLRATHYRNGEPIPEIKDNFMWTTTSSGAYCDFNNTDNLVLIATFGRLYNWHAISDSRCIAPSGWHVPTDDEWSTLISYLGKEDTVGKNLKEASGDLWGNPNIISNSDSDWWFLYVNDNKSGFTATPGGMRIGHESPYYAVGTFLFIGYDGNFWSSSEDGNGEALYRMMYFDDNGVYRYSSSKNNGYSIRCVKDKK